MSVEIPKGSIGAPNGNGGAEVFAIVDDARSLIEAVRCINTSTSTVRVTTTATFGAGRSRSRSHDFGPGDTTVTVPQNTAQRLTTFYDSTRNRLDIDFQMYWV